jgi:hypothetical protein
VVLRNCLTALANASTIGLARRMAGLSSHHPASTWADLPAAVGVDARPSPSQHLVLVSQTPWSQITPASRSEPAVVTAALRDLPAEGAEAVWARDVSALRDLPAPAWWASYRSADGHTRRAAPDGRGPPRQPWGNGSGTGAWSGATPSPAPPAEGGASWDRPKPMPHRDTWKAAPSVRSYASVTSGADVTE